MDFPQSSRRHLGASDEPIQVFCIHDADGPGTLIYEALQGATKARPEREVEVINLGLEPWEAMELGLQPECIEKENEEVLSQLGETELREMDDILAALSRLDAGTYGSCERCGSKIQEERLEALPFAITCIACAQ